MTQWSNEVVFCHDLPTRPQPDIGKILVTGATGYIGGRLVPELLVRGYDVRVMVRGDSSDHQARWPGADRGGMVLAIDLEQVVDGDLFRAETDRYSRDVRANYAPIPGTDAAWLPGASEEQCMVRSRAEGIRFGEPEQNAVRAMHQHFSVPLPWG